MKTASSTIAFAMLLILQSAVQVNARYLDSNQRLNNQATTIRTARCGRQTGTFIRPRRIQGLNIGRFSQEYVNGNDGVLHEFRRSIKYSMDLIRPTKDAWSLRYMQVHYHGLQDLNPTVANTSGLTNTPLSHSHRILREMRWLQTAMDFYAQLMDEAGQLGPTYGHIISSNINALSNPLDSILRIFGVHFGSLPEDAICRETGSLTVDSRSVLTLFTSLALRDIYNALERIHHVLSSCQAVDHHEGPHLLRLDCSHPSLFYHGLPFGDGDDNIRLLPLDYFERD